MARKYRCGPESFVETSGDKDWMAAVAVRRELVSRRGLIPC
jgi:hypothetical protein